MIPHYIIWIGVTMLMHLSHRTWYRNRLHTGNISPNFYNIPVLVFHGNHDRELLLTWKILMQDFQIFKLKSLLCIFYRRHDEFIDRYNISFLKDDKGYVSNVTTISSSLPECDQPNNAYHWVFSYINYTMDATCRTISSYS